MLYNKTEKTPMYQWIVEQIKEKIVSGEYRPNDPLPTQIDLARQYNTSEITSRRALTDLVQEGYIYRIRGKGSFVSQHMPDGRPKAMRTIYFAHTNLPIDLFSHRFFSDMLTGISEVCEANGIAFYTWDIGSDYQLPDDPDAGIILLTNAKAFDLVQLSKWRDEQRRLITVHFYYPHLGIPYVIVDNLTGGYLATQHLISLGHSRIGVILTGSSLEELNQEFSLRLQGYRLAQSQHQLAYDPGLVVVMAGDTEDMATGYKGFKALMALPNPPTAVFATSDYKALGAMKAAREMGIRVPEDVSLIGYDDVVAGQYSLPSLTTVNQYTHKLGERAAEMLLFEWDDSPSRVNKDEIVPQVIIRDTTAELKL